MEREAGACGPAALDLARRSRRCVLSERGSGSLVVIVVIIIMFNSNYPRVVRIPGGTSQAGA